MSSTKKTILILCGFLIFISLYHSGILTVIALPVRFLVHPLTRASIAAGQTTNVVVRATRASKEELTREINTLNAKVNDLQLEIIRLQDVQQENNALRALIDFRDTQDSTIVMATVTFKNNEEIARVITINKGSKSRIKKGYAVITGAGTLIGTIDRVEPESARIRLSIDPKSTILATLMESEHTITGVLAGVQGTGLTLQLIPKNVPLFPEERVVTNGLQEGIPRNLYLGDVIRLEENEDEIFNTAYVKSPYTIEDISLVGVVIP